MPCRVRFRPDGFGCGGLGLCQSAGGFGGARFSGIQASAIGPYAVIEQAWGEVRKVLGQVMGGCDNGAFGIRWSNFGQASGFCDEGAHPAVRLDRPVIAGEHLEVAEGDSTALAGDGADPVPGLVYLFTIFHIGKVVYAGREERLSEADNRFCFEDAVSGGCALTVVAEEPSGEGFRIIGLRRANEVRDGVPWRGGGAIDLPNGRLRPAPGFDGFFCVAVPDANGKDGVDHAEGQGVVVELPWQADIVEIWDAGPYQRYGISYKLIQIRDSPCMSLFS